MNLVPVPVGGVLTMWNNTNPAELYPSTTWELITSGKYIQSGSTALQTGGSNSVSIQKVNLPNVKLKVDSFSVTTKAHNHAFPSRTGFDDGSPTKINVGAPIGSNMGTLYTNNGGGQNTGTASPNTETLGSGTALTIQPEYITLKFWKRLT